MNDEIKTKLQKLENIRVYANNNTHFLRGEIGGLKSDIYKLTAEIYKDPRAIDDLMNDLELNDKDREYTADKAHQELSTTPHKVSKLKETMFGLGGDADAKDQAAKLADMVVKYKDVLIVEEGYDRLSQRAMAARKLKPDQLDDELDLVHNEREFMDAQRDTRIKGRVWSPWDSKLQHLDKGLQMSPEEREKAREMALAEGLENPLSR